MKTIFFAAIFLAATLPGSAQQPPVYVVNGKVVADAANIPPEVIESEQMLPADEETIARYGEQASNGVLLITLKYDEPAVFPADSLSFGHYIAEKIAWPQDNPVARVSLRYTITTDGQIVVGNILQSTDSRLKRRVLKAVIEAPRWQPATKNGKPVETEGVLTVQLPAGREMLQEPIMVW